MQAVDELSEATKELLALIFIENHIRFMHFQQVRDELI
jgi:hypothetical protein